MQLSELYNHIITSSVGRQRESEGPSVKPEALLWSNSPLSSSLLTPEYPDEAAGWLETPNRDWAALVVYQTWDPHTGTGFHGTRPIENAKYKAKWPMEVIIIEFTFIEWQQQICTDFLNVSPLLFF